MGQLLSSRRLPWILGSAVAVAGTVGSWIVMRGYGLSLDEFFAVFQGDLILEGWPFGRVPEEWRWIQDALQPVFVHHDPEQGVWGPRYLPVNGAILALFSTIGIDGLAHGLMAGRSDHPALARCRRRASGHARGTAAGADPAGLFAAVRRHRDDAVRDDHPPVLQPALALPPAARRADRPDRGGRRRFACDRHTPGPQLSRLCRAVSPGHDVRWAAAARASPWGRVRLWDRLLDRLAGLGALRHRRA